MIVTMLLSLALQDAATPSPVKPKPKPARKICKALEETGSRMGGAPECHTAAEWTARQSSTDPRLLNDMNNIAGRNAGLQHY